MGGPIELERKTFWTWGQKKTLKHNTYLILWVTRGKNWNILLLDLCSTSVLQITTSKMVTYVFYIQSHPPVRIFFLFFFIFKGYVLCCKNNLCRTHFLLSRQQQIEKKTSVNQYSFQQLGDLIRDQVRQVNLEFFLFGYLKICHLISFPL